MKKLKLLAAFLLLPSLILLADSGESLAMRLLRQYDSQGFFIVNTYLKAPTRFEFKNGVSIRLGGTRGFRMYLSGSGLFEVLGSLNTVVHEMCHGFTSRMPYVLLQRSGRYRSGNFSAFYIDTKRCVLVRHTKTFPSAVFRRMIPAALRKYRYPTYIYPSSENLGTQVHGIYGLMDEWNAYYHGTMTSVRIVDRFLRMRPSVRVWMKALTEIYGTLYAGAEFQLFLLTALEYAEKFRPSVFNAVMANSGFITAYQLIHKNWKQLHRDVEIVRRKVFSRIRKNGYSVKMSSRMIMITSEETGEGRGSGHFMDFYKNLMGGIRRAALKRIHKRIMGIAPEKKTIFTVSG